LTAKETFTKSAETQIRLLIESWAQAISVKDAAGVVAAKVSFTTSVAKSSQRIRSGLRT
jgi:hypothetical protein